jgi:hypothetical protein
MMFQTSIHTAISILQGCIGFIDGHTDLTAREAQMCTRMKDVLLILQEIRNRSLV